MGSEMCIRDSGYSTIHELYPYMVRIRDIDFRPTYYLDKTNIIQTLPAQFLINFLHTHSDIAFFKLGLIQQYNHIRVIYDRLFHNGRINNILYFLRNYTYIRPKFTGCFKQILNIFCHQRRSNSLPCFLNYQSLALLLDAHLLLKNIHNNQGHQWEQ
mgnify:CR=1 FL=1